MPALVRAATALAALAAARVAARHLMERASARRLPRAPDGLIVGAEPLDLRGEPGAPAALLLHGFGDTPQSLAALARRLHEEEGWTVRVPLLPGHGRSLRDFARTGADDWLACAREEWRALRERHPRALLVGQSMGGALAAILAAETPALPALVLLAPYLVPGPGLSRLARLRHVVDAAWPYVPSGGAKSILDPEARRAARSYGALTGRLARELETTVRRARRALGAIAAPTLVIQSRSDNRTSAVAAEEAFAAIGAREKALEKSLVWLERCGHVVSVDHERERVYALTVAWLASAARAESIA